MEIHATKLQGSVSVFQDTKGFTVTSVRRAFIQPVPRFKGSAGLVTANPMDPSAQLVAALGSASVKRVLEVPNVTTAKMGIMASMRLAVSPANAIISLSFVIPSQVLV